MTFKSNFPQFVRKDEPTGGAAAVNLGDMPEWNLTHLYDGPDSPVLSRDLADLDSRIAVFESHRGKVVNLGGAEFGSAIAAYEAIDELLGKVASYAQLYQSVDVSDPARGRFYQDTLERLTDLSGRLLFFTLEINRLDDSILADKMKHESAARYAPWTASSAADRSPRIRRAMPWSAAWVLAQLANLDRSSLRVRLMVGSSVT